MDTVTGRSRCDMKAVGNLCGVIKMFMQGVNVFENAAAPANDEIVNGDDVLGVFRKGNATNMLERANLSRQHVSLTLEPSLSFYFYRDWRKPTGCSGMWNFAAINITAMTSFNPPRRQASVWT